MHFFPSRTNASSFSRWPCRADAHTEPARDAGLFVPAGQHAAHDTDVVLDGLGAVVRAAGDADLEFVRRLLAEIERVELRRQFLGFDERRGADRRARAGHDAPAPGAAHAEHDAVLVRAPRAPLQDRRGGRRWISTAWRVVRCTSALPVFLRRPGQRRSVLPRSCRRPRS